MDAGRAPERVGQAHVPDQPTDLQRDARSPAAPSGFPTPERSKSSPVPTNHGLRPDDGQRVYNARSEAIQPNEHQSVESPKTNLFGDLRRSTLICCRRTRISASSRTLERNKLVSAVHSSMRTSTIGHEHHPIRPASQPDRVSDKDKCHSFRTLRLPGVKPETNRVTMPGVALRISASFLRRMAVRTSLAPR